MRTNTQLDSQTHNFGNTAVDGIFAGFLGGAIMLMVLLGFALLSGQTAVELLGLFDPRLTQSPLQGLVSHLAVSGIYGLIYAVGTGFVLLIRPHIRPQIRRYHPISGTLFGLLLALMARLWILPVSDSPLLNIPLAIFIVVHLIYGFTVGLQLGRRLEMLS